MSSRHSKKGSKAAVNKRVDPIQENSSMGMIDSNISTMLDRAATAKMNSHKRTRSIEDEDVAASNAGTEKVLPEVSLVLVHLNALLKAKGAVLSTMRSLIAELSADKETPRVTDQDIMSAMCKTPLIDRVLEEVGIRGLTAEQRAGIPETYQRLFSQQSMADYEAALGAGEFLSELKRHDGLAVAVVSNNLTAANSLLGNLGLIDKVDHILPATAQAHATGQLAYSQFWNHWQKVVLPWYTAVTASVNDANITHTAPGTGPNTNGNGNHNGSKHPTRNTALEPKQTLVISGALYDLGIAKLTGMKTCWIKAPEMGHEAIARAAKMFDLVVDDLDELRSMWVAGGHGSESSESEYKGKGGRVSKHADDLNGVTEEEDTSEDKFLPPPVPHSSPITIASDESDDEVEPYVIDLVDEE